MQQRLTPKHDFRIADTFSMFMLDVQSRHLTENVMEFCRQEIAQRHLPDSQEQSIGCRLLGGVLNFGR
jgi:hypothetical protein